MKLFFESITHLGSIYFFALIIVLTYFFIDQTHSLKLFLSLVATLAVAFTIRFFYFKKRPNKKSYKNLFQKLYNSSFPSVHATRAVVIAYFFSKLYFNVILITVVWVIAFLVCYSRIYLKHHYVTDVVSGVILGLFVSLFIF
jgi:undecaprenyl-diphosphatase